MGNSTAIKVALADPEVKLLTRPETLVDAIANIEEAARCCYQSKMNPTTRYAFFERLLNSGHEGPFEFGYAHFCFRTSRAIANEVVRHRLFSFCQESTRYVNYVKKGQLDFIKPYWTETPAETEAFLKACTDATESYGNMLGTRHKHPEQVRDMLPLATATTIHICGNYREWRHFLQLRLAPAAHQDIQWLARQVQNEFINTAIRHGCPELGLIATHGMPYSPAGWSMWLQEQGIGGAKLGA